MDRIATHVLSRLISENVPLQKAERLSQSLRNGLQTSSAVTSAFAAADVSRASSMRASHLKQIESEYGRLVEQASQGLTDIQQAAFCFEPLTNESTGELKGLFIQLVDPLASAADLGWISGSPMGVPIHSETAESHAIRAGRRSYVEAAAGPGMFEVTAKDKEYD